MTRTDLTIGDTIIMQDKDANGEIVKVTIRDAMGRTVIISPRMSEDCGVRYPILHCEQVR